MVAFQVERRTTGKKPGKRKVDSEDEEKSEPQRVKREASTVKKETQHNIAPVMKPCLKLLNELYSKKYHVSFSPLTYA